MRCRISRGALGLIRRETAAAGAREACGLLFGADARIADASVAANVAPVPERHFEIDPAALFAAIRAERAGGPALVGYWHSHPSGDATPSVTDAASAAPDGKLWLIAAGAEVTCWRAGHEGLHGRFAPVALEEAAA